MENEKIEVGYRNIGTIAGKDYYHKFLLYTNKYGQQFTISGWSDPEHATANFPMGKIRVQTGLQNNPPTTGLVYDESNPDHFNNENTWLKDKHGHYIKDINGHFISQKQYREIIIEAPDLSEKWHAMTHNAENKDNIYPYDFIDQNSNSLADVILREADLPQPQKDGFTHYFSPGSFNHNQQELNKHLIPKDPNQTGISEGISTVLSENDQYKTQDFVSQGFDALLSDNLQQSINQMLDSDYATAFDAQAKQLLAQEEAAKQQEMTQSQKLYKPQMTKI